MSETKANTEIERAIAAAVERATEGSPEAIAREIISELQRAGQFIVPRDLTDKMSAAVARSRDQGHWGLVSEWHAMVDAAQ